MNKIIFLVQIFIFIHSPCILAVDIYGHRGATGLAPENTIHGYKTALKIGVDAIDMDIGLTRDNIIILNHDAYLNPDFTQHHNGEWIESAIPIRALSFKELSNFHVGKMRGNSKYAKEYPLKQNTEFEKIPSLLQTLVFVKKHAPKDIKIQIEIKTSPIKTDNTAIPQQIVPKLIETIRFVKLKNPIEVHSFDWKNLILLKQYNEDISLSFLTSDKEISASDTNIWQAGYSAKDFHNSYPELIKHLGGNIWCPYFENINADDVNNAHHLGLKVNAWTVDTEKDMSKMLDIGVDGIITNRPDVLRGVMAARGLNIPKGHNFT
jgi:glycerophosphoryl diester phosphodiesterase